MFKPILENAEEITDFIITYTSYSIDEEFVQEYFFGCKAFLRKVSILDLREEDENQHIKDEVKERRYEKLPIESMPPLIVEDGIVKDGHHRYRVAKKKDIKEMIIYDIVSAEI